MERRGIEVLAHNVHMKADRALQTTCTFLNESDRIRVIEIWEKIDPKMALGVENMATMVVSYRNSPNQIPAVLRGNKDLKPFRGIFPRTTDLPFKKIVQEKKLNVVNRRLRPSRVQSAARHMSVVCQFVFPGVPPVLNSPRELREGANNHNTARKHP